MTFSDKHIVITGGSSGLGLALAERLIMKGAKVSLVARDIAKLNAAKDKLAQLSASAQVQVASIDVSAVDAVKEGFQSLTTVFGDIDILINSAGILRVNHFEDFAIEDYRDLMETNYFGLVSCIQAALPSLKKTRGKIVNIASIAGLVGTFGYSPYNASKYAVIGLSEALRYEFAPRGVRVQLICPGEFDTPMVQGIANERPRENIAHTHMIPPLPLDTVADKTLSGIASEKFLVVPGILARLTVGLVQHFPSLARWLGDRVIAKVQRKQRGVN